MRVMQIPSDHPLLLRIVDDLAERALLLNLVWTR